MNRFYTPLCDLLNIEVPIIQAPIGPAASPKLASDVSNAGGLGMLALGNLSAEQTRRAIRETTRLTSKPFGANLLLHKDQEERLKICLEEGVKIISFFWGDSSPHIKRVHESGAIAMHTVGSAAEARIFASKGIDIIVTQGWEAGGHVWGEVATLPLVPAVVDAVAPKPVVAAGGITDGRGIAAALMLGAAGVWIGTRFLASEEAAVHQIYKEKILNANETDTVLTRLFNIGWDAPHRVLRNSTVKMWEEAGKPPQGKRPREGEVIAKMADGSELTRYNYRGPGLGITGDLEALALYCGQGASLVRSILPASEIIKQLTLETVQALDEAKSLIK